MPPCWHTERWDGLCHASPADTPWLSSSAPPAYMRQASSFTPELTWLLLLHSTPIPPVGSVPSTRLLSGLTSKTWILLQKTHWQEGQAKIQTLPGNKGTGQSQDSGVWVLQGSDLGRTHGLWAAGNKTPISVPCKFPRIPVEPSLYSILRRERVF